MKKNVAAAVILLVLLTALTVFAAPGTDEQISLIAANADLWKQDNEYESWGYIVTDLDQNGRLEIISCSVQGSGFYSYVKAFEVREDGSGLTEIRGLGADRTDSLPDIWTGSVPFYFDRETGVYYYIFNDMIRNGMAEYYENKRAVSITDGTWQEIQLASKVTLYSDPEHFTITRTGSQGEAISEAQYESIAETVFKGLGAGEIRFNWITTDTREFGQLSLQQLTDSLKEAADDTKMTRNY